MSNTTTKGSGPAFPTESDSRRYHGMSFRSYLAAQETLSDLDNPDYGLSISEKEALAGRKKPNSSDAINYLLWEIKARAVLKVMRADALIAALSEEKEGKP